MLTKSLHKHRRALRVRSRIHGTWTNPRLSVFRSNAHIAVQAIDDERGVTLFSTNDTSVKKGTKTEKAQTVGRAIAEKLIAWGITTCTFDRGGNLYHGRVKALADAAREAWLQF